MKWNIAASFFTTDSRWLDDFCADSDICMVKILPPETEISWHKRTAVTGIFQWIQHLRHGHRALQGNPSGVITCFPQLALTVSLMKLFSRRRRLGIIAWNFNLGTLQGKLKSYAAGYVLRQVDLFVVHSKAEISAYSEWLSLPAERFVFVPLPRAKTEIHIDEDTVVPFVLSMGSAGRDYKTFTAAMRHLQYDTVIVAKQDILNELDDYEWLTKKTNLSQRECLDLSCRARINVVPLDDLETAAGQVTIVNAIRMGRPTIATKTIGSEDYIIHGETGLLVEPSSVTSMKLAIERLWHDHFLREKLTKNAFDYSARFFSDEAAAKTLLDLIGQVHCHSSNNTE